MLTCVSLTTTSLTTAAGGGGQLKEGLADHACEQFGHRLDGRMGKIYREALRRAGVTRAEAEDLAAVLGQDACEGVVRSEHGPVVEVGVDPGSDPALEGPELDDRPPLQQRGRDGGLHPPGMPMEVDAFADQMRNPVRGLEVVPYRYRMGRLRAFG